MAAFLLPAEELQYVVLTKLWELDPGSVREVRGRLGEPEGLVYTTIAKVIDRLRATGLIQRERHGKERAVAARLGVLWLVAIVLGIFFVEPWIDSLLAMSP
jgi:predicted transcriptional regulator